MKSSAYWRKRFELLEQKSNEYGLDAFRQIEPAFIQAEKEIQKEIESWYGRYARNNGVSMTEARRQLSTKELKEFRWDVNEYIKYGRENAIDQRWMKQLENASARVHINRLEALKIRTQQAAEVAFGNELNVIDAMARKVYTEDYYHSIFEMQKGFGVGWEIGQVDERKLGQLISKPWAADGKNFSQRIWNHRDQLVNELHTQMTRTCILGEPPKKIIDTIAKKFNTTKNQAGRLVMTEQAFFHSAAQKDAFKELEVEEFEVVATLDSSTSDTCQDMDGEHFPMSEYEPGVTAPPFHVWCRSVTAPYFEDNYGGERAARDVDGKTYYVPDDMKYKDWKKSFVNGDTSGLTVVTSDDTIIAGGLSGALNAGSKAAFKHAKQYYESVRKMTTDCELISKNTGFDLYFVQTVKNHLFMTKHDLGNGELEYFYPDYEIAQSWQRMMDSNMKIQPHDLILLEHEHAEYLYMSQGMTQSEAHEKAEELYNYAKALKERK